MAARDETFASDESSSALDRDAHAGTRTRNGGIGTAETKWDLEEAVALPRPAGDTGWAMSQENIDRLRAAYEAFNQTGKIVVAHLAPDFELRQASSIIDTAGVFRGPDAFRDVLRELEESFEDFKAEAEKFIEAPTGEIVVFLHVLGRGRGSGAEMDNRIAHVWTYRDDKAVRMVAYEEPADALEAVGLRE